LSKRSRCQFDKLSGGRFDFGVGIGLARRGIAAVGVPWERRAQRTREYLEAMKRLWTEEEPQFKGEFCSFPKVCSYPNPLQKPHPPFAVAALKILGLVG
jgi:alkanesulfonate monooxygenase SsuD/methylene tetrahydromethanopterin reductase-like flavin-dependent oxidoreductase (luciferase family)